MAVLTLASTTLVAELPEPSDSKRSSRAVAVARARGGRNGGVALPRRTTATTLPARAGAPVTPPVGNGPVTPTTAASPPPSGGGGGGAPVALPAPTTTTTTRPVAPPTTVPPTTTTTATTTVPSPPPLPVTRPGFVGRSGDRLILDGSYYRFTGVTAYQLTTFWPVNWGCGSMSDDRTIDDFFGSLRDNSMVKVTATQSMAFNNKSTFTTDWGPIDRVVAAAERHGVKLIMSLATQQGDCDDGHWKDAAWYSGGYRNTYNDDGRNVNPRSYWDWIHMIVPRYKDSPAVGMWQLVVEPEAANCAPGFGGNGCYGRSSCPPNAAAVLRGFFDTVGGEVKRMDPDHLINSAVIGGGHCGMVGNDYKTIHASPFIDVASFHDYHAADLALPPEVAYRLAQADELDKPLIIDEVGIPASDVAPGCRSRVDRRDRMREKLEAMFAAGADGFTPWNWSSGTNPGRCDLDVATDDPLLAYLRSVAL